MRRNCFISVAVVLLLLGSGFYSTTVANAADEEFVMKAANGGRMEVLTSI